MTAPFMKKSVSSDPTPILDLASRHLDQIQKGFLSAIFLSQNTLSTVP